MTQEQGKGSPSFDLPKKVVGIGASAGGLEAFKRFFTTCTEECSQMAFVVVQHLEPAHRSLLVELLASSTSLTCREASDGQSLLPGHVYTIAPGKRLEVADHKVQVFDNDSRADAGRVVDYMFQSLAESWGARSVAVVLTGSGTDGAEGVKAVKKAGGLVIVQLPESAAFPGMPEAAVSTGLADYVIPLESMSSCLLLGGAENLTVAKGALNHVGPSWDEDVLEKILKNIQAQTDYDFSAYKNSTLMRRIERRIGLKKLSSVDSYVKALEEDRVECLALVNDLLIGVTHFFRDNETWDALVKMGIRPLIKNLPDETSIRAWVPGCATGEEAYSLAILIQEELEREGRNLPIQIFATDTDERGLQIARAGSYPKAVVEEHVSSERLNRFFMREGDSWRIIPELRENIVFSRQNLLEDPPLSQLHILRCANVLIYIKPEVQKKILRVFHFALRPGGALVLGNAETAGQAAQLFEPVYESRHIFRRVGGVPRGGLSLPMRSQAPARNALPSAAFEREVHKNDLAYRVQKILLSEFGPAAVLINKSCEILYYSGNTADYLQQRTGTPSVDIFSLAKEWLVTRLRSAVHKAFQGNERIFLNNIRVPDDEQRRVSITAIPLRGPGPLTDTLLIVLRDQNVAPSQLHMDEVDSEEENLIQQLEMELLTTKEDLQTTIEALEASNEELKASNEEVMSMNEELQSSNEELETSKEELQSLNEELATLNNELQEKVEDLEAANADLYNFIEGTSVAILFLDVQLQIRRFTPAVRDVMNVIATDEGRSFADIALRVNDTTLSEDLHAVLADQKPRRAIVQNDQGRWFQRRVLPYRMGDGSLAGVTLVFDDVTEIREANAEIANSRMRLSTALEAGMMGIWDWDVDEDILIWDGYHEALLGFEPGTFDGRFSTFTERVHPEDRAMMMQALQQARKNHSQYEYEFRVVLPDGSIRWIASTGAFVNDDTETAAGHMLGVVRDVTARIEAARELAANEKRHRQILDSITDGFFSLDADMCITYFNHAAEIILQRKALEVIGQPLLEAFPEARGTVFDQHYRQAFAEGRTISFEAYFDAAPYRDWYDVRVYPHSEGIAVFFTVITERKKAEIERDLRLKLLNELSQAGTLREALKPIVNMLQEWAGCEMVGIRIRDGFEFPYFETRGMEQQFLESETSLCQYDQAGNCLCDEDGQPVLSCLCGDLISGKVDTSSPYITEHGAFWTNSLSELFESKQSWVLNHSRNACLEHGYESLTLIPFHGPQGVLGLVQLADHQKNMFTNLSVNILEQLVSNTALALAHRKTWMDYQVSEERFRLAFQNANIGMCFLDLHGNFARVNDALCSILGYEKEELEYKSASSFLDPEDEGLDEAFVLHALKGRSDYAHFEKRFVHKNGELIWALVSSSLVRDSDNEPLYFILHIVDVTLQRTAEQNIRNSEEALRRAQQLAHVGSWKLWVRDGILEWSDEMFRIFGLEPEGFDGKLESVVETVVHPEDKEKLRAANRAVRKGEKLSPLEYRIVWSDGTVRYVWAEAGRMVADEDGQALFLEGFAQDVTEQRQLQERMRQMQKMDAVGQLAGGVAHDFNNQLSGIMGFAELLSSRLDDERLKRYADSILVASRRSADLTGKLLAFSRQGQYQKQLTDMHEIIAETVSILRHSIDKRIAIKQLLEANPAVVVGDPTQLQSALLNLALNARDAMPTGGELTVETRTIHLSSSFGTHTGELSAGNYLVINIVDTGMGMDEEVKKRVFEPFFSTKEIGDGAGMGLASVYGTVQNHEGGICLESVKGEGTTFSVFLPLTAEVAALDHSGEQGQEDEARELSILLIDDEESVRDVVSELLKDEGHCVKVAADGREGVEVYREEGDHIDVVVLDMIMPKMNGRDCYKALQELDPDVQVVIATGYTLDEDTQKMLDKGVLGFVQKPFSLANLNKALEQATRER